MNKEEIEIQELKKNDKFRFNDTVYTVTKKYRNDDSPLKAIDEHHSEQLFHNEELKVRTINN